MRRSDSGRDIKIFFLLAIVSNLQKRSLSSLTTQQPKMKLDVLARILS